MKDTPEDIREGLRMIAGLCCEVWRKHPVIELVVHNEHKGPTNYDGWKIEVV